MADTNLDPSISALSTRATEVAASASPRELLNLSRIAPSLEQSENAGLEVAINSRAAGLAPSATATELKSIGKAIGNVLEPDTFTAGAFIPAQLDQSGKFLGTSGTSKNWSGVTVSGLSEVNISAIANDETLVYNNVSSQFENSSQVFNIPQYAQTADLPASATSGATAFDASTAELKYWDGSEWKVAAVGAAAGGGSGAITWTGNITSLYSVSAPAPVSGHALSEYYGRATAMNANYFAIGDSRDDINNTNTGSVYVYSLTDGSLQYTISGTAEYHEIGMQTDTSANSYPIAMSENLLLIGWGADRSVSEGGQRVRLYNLATGNLLHEYLGTAAGGTSHNTFKDEFGASVSINADETKIAIGAPRWRYSTSYQQGAVLIFDISNLNSLSSTPIKIFYGNDGGGASSSANVDSGDQYGHGIKFSGVNTISVTALHGQRAFVYDVSDAGYTHKYAVDGRNIDRYNSYTIDSFGEWDDPNFVLAIGNRNGGALVDQYQGTGEVYIYKQSDLSSNTTVPTTTISEPYQDSRATNGGFGTGLKILGNDHILIGMRSTSAGNYDGKAYIYNLDGTQVTEISNPDTANVRRFGRAVDADLTSGKILITADKSSKAFVYQSEQTAAGGGSGSSGLDWSGTLSSILFATDKGSNYDQVGDSVTIDDTYYAIGGRGGVVSIYYVADDSEKRTFTSTVNNQGGEVRLNGSGKLAVHNGNASGQIWIHDIEGNTVDTISTGAIPYDSYTNRTQRGFDFDGKWFAFRDGAVNKWNSHPTSSRYAEQGRLYIYDIENGPSGGTSPLYEIDEATIIGALETDGSFGIVDGLSGSNEGNLVVDSASETLWISFPGAAGTTTATGFSDWGDRGAGVVVPIDLTTGNVVLSKVIPNPQLRDGVASTQSQLPNAGDTPFWWPGPGNTWPSNNRTQPRSYKFGSSLAVSSTHIAIASYGAATNEWTSQGTSGAVFVYNISGASPLLEAIIYQAIETSALDYYRSNATGTGGNTLLLPTRAQYFPNNYISNSLALSDNHLFIGSRYSGPDGASDDNNNKEGAVFIVDLSDYSLAQNINNPAFIEGSVAAAFGHAVDVHGNKLVVGENLRSPNQPGGGHLFTLS